MTLGQPSTYVHYYHPRHQLLCGYVGVQVGWATRPEHVDCPECRARLAAAAIGPEGRMTPIPARPRTAAPLAGVET